MTLALPFLGWGQDVERTGKTIVQGTITGFDGVYNIYTARDTVRLTSGFDSKDVLGNRNFIARIDESIICDVDYQDPIDPDLPVDTDKPVGAIAGVVDVSPTGAATYQIPIFTPPGTAGMEPQISIVYNSQGGNGLLGVGWDIAGLSAITRTGQTIYHDGKVTPISLDTTDRLLLDGNRLILTNNSIYGSIGATYATEIETFSKITAYSMGGNDPDCKFEVKAKDGQTLEYGYTDDSRFYIGSLVSVAKILQWRLNKITDANGNYIKYIYKKDNTEQWIDKIEYTGNTAAGKDPYASITFLYSTREDVQGAYVLGTEYTVQSTKLLRGIKVESEGQVVRRYWFNYAKQNRYSHLVEIIEEGNDGKSPNSTIVQWGEDMEYTWAAFDEGTIPNWETMADYTLNGKKSFFTLVESSRAWKIFGFKDFDEGIEIYHSGNIATTYQRINKFHISHPDKDGKTHVFIDQRSNNGKKSFHNVAEYISDQNGLTKTNTSILCEFDDTYNREYPYFFTGDCTGDGSIHYMLITPNPFILSSMVSTNLNISNLSFPIPFPNTNMDKLIRTVRFVDLTGDGKDELMLIADSITHVYRYTNNSFEEIFSTNLVLSGQEIFHGDFNGDGKTDLLLKNKDYTATILISTGKGFIKYDAPVGFKHTYNNSVYNNSLAVGDIDGDGKSDIAVIQAGDGLIVFYSKGDGTYENKGYGLLNIEGLSHYYPYYATIADHQGVGNGMFCVQGIMKNSDSRKLFFVSFDKTSHGNRVKSITNGVKSKIEFEYKTLPARGDFYTPEFKETTPLVDGVMHFHYPLCAVSKMTSSNGVGGTTSASFSYKGAKLHRKGKGFLGFSEMKMADNSMGITTKNSYKYNNDTYFHVYLNKVETMLTSDVSKKIKTVDYEVLLHAWNIAGGKNFFPCPSKTTTEDHLTTMKTFEKFIYDGDNGNLKIHEIKYGDPFMFIDSICYDYQSFGNWGVKNKVTEKKTKSMYANNSSIKPYQRQSSYNYNNNGVLITETSDNGVVTNYQNLNAFGLPKTISTTATGALPYSKTLEYDDNGKFVTKISDPLGSTTKKHDPAGNLQFEIGITGLKTSYKYDGFGRQTGVKTPEGHIIATDYKWGQDDNIHSISCVEVTAPGRPKSVTYYDISGREVRSKIEGYDGRMIVTDQEYNAQGQLDRTSLPYFNGGSPKWTVNEYDQYGRIKTTTAELGTYLVTQYDYSNNTTTVTSPDGKSVAKTYDAHGDLIKIIENGNSDYTIDYLYHTSGQPREITTGGATFKMTYDQFGRQDTLFDPNAGTISYTYNAFGDVLTQKDARGNITTNVYDNLRRMDFQKITAEPDKKWNYHTSGNGKGQLKSITSSKVELHYDYGDFGRLTKMTEKIIGDQSFETQYAYDEYGNTTEITYPGGFKINQIYNNKGYITEIRQASNNQMVWQRLTENAQGQPLTYKMGNNKITNYEYDEDYLLERTHTPGIQDFSYSINSKSGNMNWRRDNLQNLQENFYYDSAYRLDNVKKNSSITLAMSYDYNGNIKTKSDVTSGEYVYHNTKNHAVEHITNPLEILQESGEQTIIYNSYHKTTQITQENRQLKIEYGVDQQRIRSLYYESNQLKKTKYFAASYEKEIEHTTEKTKNINYISTPYGTLAAYITENNVGQMYYLYKDHLGSITAITNAAGAVIERRSFDAWGRLRNPDNWIYSNIPAMTILDRGYTGHEHLFGFDLINMNGRMYDPIIGRFLSPDPYVQAPFATQNYNRYSYCLNNPMRFTDPSGEFFFAAVGIGTLLNAMCWGAVITGAAYVASVATLPGGFNNNWNWGQFGKSVLMGAVSGLATAGVGAAFGEVGSLGFLGEVARAGTHAAAQATISAAFGQEPTWGGVAVSLTTSMFGSAMAGEPAAVQIGFAGIIGGVTAGASGGDFWQGFATGVTIAGLNHVKHQLGGGSAAKYFKNKKPAYAYMWHHSVVNGVPTREVSAWELEDGGIIVLPYDENGIDYSHNNALKVVKIDGKRYVQFNGKDYAIATHVHTHPEMAGPSAHPIGLSQSDLNLQKQMGVPINIIYNRCIYSIDGTYNYREKVWNYKYIGTW